MSPAVSPVPDRAPICGREGTGRAILSPDAGSREEKQMESLSRAVGGQAGPTACPVRLSWGLARPSGTRLQPGLLPGGDSVVVNAALGSSRARGSVCSLMVPGYVFPGFPEEAAPRRISETWRCAYISHARPSCSFELRPERNHRAPAAGTQASFTKPTVLPCVSSGPPTRHLAFLKQNGVIS